MLLPNTLDASAPALTFIDAIKPLYKHTISNQEMLQHYTGVKEPKVFIMFSDVN